MDAAKLTDTCLEARLTQMIDDYQKPLLNLCYVYLRDRELAEDAVQETFLKAYRAWRTFRGESQEKTWLTRIAINTCRDMRKSAWSVHVNRKVIPEEMPIAANANFDQEAFDLAQAIMQLPEKYREVILLHYYQEMPMTEIATAIGVTTSMVSRRIKKAHEKLHEILGKEYLHG